MTSAFQNFWPSCRPQLGNDFRKRFTTNISVQCAGWLNILDEVHKLFACLNKLTTIYRPSSLFALRMYLFYASFKGFFDPLNFLHRDIFVSSCFLLTPRSIFRFISPGIYRQKKQQKTKQNKTKGQVLKMFSGSYNHDFHHYQLL